MHWRTGRADFPLAALHAETIRHENGRDKAVDVQDHYGFSFNPG